MGKKVADSSKLNDALKSIPTKSLPVMTNVKAYKKESLTLVPRKALGGIVRWYQTIRADRLGIELHVTTNADRVFVNGKRVKL